VADRHAPKAGRHLEETEKGEDAMGAARNRLKRDACAVCKGSGESDGLADCSFCAGTGVEPTIAELRDRLSAAERKAVAQREAGLTCGAELAAELGGIRAQLRQAERAANGDK
jgi:RecJ-like exonuclease